ncbi:MAG: hypothetical protein ACK5YR_07215 [Pirellula sp.]|jgi:hypothetical protein
MNQRTKWLIAGGAIVFGLYGADSIYRSWIEEPEKQLTARLDDLSSDLQKTKDQQLQAQRAGKRYEDYLARALPGDPQTARSVYQKWLLTQIERFEITSSSVDASQPSAIELKSRTKKGKRDRIGYRIDFSLRGQASLSKLAGFLDEFRNAGMLHKLASVTLNPIGNEGRLDVSLSIQVLSLDGATNDTELTQWRVLPEVIAERSSNNTFVKRNLFARGFAKALYDVSLKAITVNRKGESEAWFTVDNKGTVAKIQAGSNVPVALHEITVVALESDRAQINVNQDVHWIKLGESVGKVTAPKESVPE